MCAFFFFSGKAGRRIVSEKTMFSRQNTDESAGKQAYVCDQNLMQMKLFQYLMTHNEVYIEIIANIYAMLSSPNFKTGMFFFSLQLLPKD